MSTRIAVLSVSDYKIVWNGVEYICAYGLNCQMLTFLTTCLKQQFAFVPVTDGGGGGILTKNGTWNGLIGLLQRNEADIATQIGLSYERSKVVKFSHPLEIISVVFALPSAQETHKDLVFLRPFQLPVWLGIMVSIVLCSFIYSAIFYKRTRKGLGKFYFLDNILTSVEIFLGMRDFPNTRMSVGIRMFIILVVLSMEIVAYSFSAVLLSFLVEPFGPLEIKTFQQLGQAANKSVIKIALCEGSYVTNAILNAKEGVMKEFLENSMKNIDIIGQNNWYPHELLLKGYSIIGYSSFIKTTTFMFPEGQIFISDDILEYDFGGFAFRKDYRFTEKINKLLLRLYETGVYEHLLDEEKFRWQLKHQFKIPEAEGHKPLLLPYLEGIFYFLIVGLILSVLVFACEIWSNKVCS